MPLNKPIFELVEEIRDWAEKADGEEAHSALVYCVKQLKISARAKAQHDGRNDSDESEYN